MRSDQGETDVDHEDMAVDVDVVAAQIDDDQLGPLKFEDLGEPGDPLYNQRGKAEQYVKKGKNAITWTRLSCHKFRDKAARLQLHALA